MKNWLRHGGVALLLTVSVGAQVEFKGSFSATEGVVAPVEQPLRRELCLNGKWQFQPLTVPATFKAGGGVAPELPPPSADKWDATPIKIPSPWNVNTWGNGRKPENFAPDSVYYPSYPAAWDGARMGWLRRIFRVPGDWRGQRLVLHFEAVAGAAQVLVNGKPAGGHFDSFLPFEFDVTDLVADGDNELLVGVRKSNLFNIVSPDYPAGQQRTYPQGSNMDELAGIWNDVYLLAVPEVRVSGVFVQPLVDKDTLMVEVTLRNDAQRQREVTVSGEVAPWMNLSGDATPKWKLDAPTLAVAPQKITVPAGGGATLTLSATVAGRLKLWSPDAPNLSGLTVSVSEAGKVVDKKYTRFGWRQFTISGRDFLLNGKPLRLIGDFTHPFGPYVCSRRFALADFQMIKDFGGNALRPHANIMPRFWLDLADEMGVCILDESSIFGSSINLNLKEPVTWERLERHVDGLVLRDRNHPSVFGWGPGNEMFALFFKSADDEKKSGYAKLKALARCPLKLDPTRQWISVDGDEDLDGTLPVWSRHIGMGLPKDNLGAVNKPRMIGEHGGTYYAGPPLTAKINGGRSYENYAGRNEALAADLYIMARKIVPELNFFSASELIWFGLEQLPLGYYTDERPPGLADGVFFPDYADGQPGMQVERIPPYVMTLNAGFDPSLPAYKPLAMFEAMKAAFDPRGPQPCKWDKFPSPSAPPAHPAPRVSVSAVGFAGDLNGRLAQRLLELGVPLTVSGGGALLIIDAATAGADTADKAKKILSSNGTALVMVSDGGALKNVQPLFNQPLTVTDRYATSLIADRQHPLTMGFALADLYFVAKSGDAKIQKLGLDAPGGKVLLRAADTDWSLFEQQPERSKCGSILIYEHVKKPAGAALVELPAKRGTLLVTTLDLPAGKEPEKFWRQLLANLGVKFVEPKTNWLVKGGPDKESSWRYTTAAPAGDDWQTLTFNDSVWQTGAGGFGTGVPGGNPRTPWHSDDIWLRQQFDVAELPAALTLWIHHDEDVEVYLNGALIFTAKGFLGDYQAVPLDAAAVKALKPGKNIIAVHCHQTAGGQYIDAGLQAGAATKTSGKKGHDLLLDGPVE
ncbi:MAG: hypothetical protein LBD30_05980 [Verrucomicrobiales bacterium]|jgi:beta-galactosidase|nr:hypothetical protein [Verrucomicrobiales bacterium]